MLFINVIFYNYKKDVKTNMTVIANVVISESRLASKVQKITAKPSYSLVGDLHGMHGLSGSSPLDFIRILAK